MPDAEDAARFAEIQERLASGWYVRLNCRDDMAWLLAELIDTAIDLDASRAEIADLRVELGDAVVETNRARVQRDEALAELAKAQQENEESVEAYQRLNRQTDRIISERDAARAQNADPQVHRLGPSSSRDEWPGCGCAWCLRLLPKPKAASRPTPAAEMAQSVFPAPHYGRTVPLDDSHQPESGAGE